MVIILRLIQRNFLIILKHKKNACENSGKFGCIQKISYDYKFMFKFEIDQYLTDKIPIDDINKRIDITIDECFNYYLKGDFKQCEYCGNYFAVNSKKICV